MPDSGIISFGLDFDDTYSACPGLWDAFITHASSLGHRVYIVTCRHDTEENRKDVRVPILPKYRHYFTGMSPKRWFMHQKGIEIDIWIDDLPESVINGRG